MKRLLYFLPLLLLLSCSSTQEKKRAPVPASSAYGELFQSAKKDLARKNYSKGFQKFNKIIHDAPETELAAESSLLMGDVYLGQGKYNEALQNYTRIINGPIKSTFEASAGLKAAQCLFNLDKINDALSRLDTALNDSSLTKEQQIAGLKLRLQILKRFISPIEELKTNLHLYHAMETEPLRQVYKSAALSIVESSLSLVQLEEVANDTKYGFVQPMAIYRLALSSFEKSHFSKARDYFSEVLKLSPNTEIAERSAELLAQIEAREKVNPNRIGVILPLTGKLSRIGYNTLRGIQLGLGIFGGKNSGIELAVIDSAGNPSTARRAVEKLVIEDHVISIIGSLSSREAMAIATKSQEFGVPTVVLSQKAGITEIGDSIFRNALTSEMQVRQLVTEAITTRGLKRFALLYPNDAYGIEYAHLFWDEVLKQGGEIRGVQSYTPGETDFNTPIKKLVGTFDARARNWEYKIRYDEWKRNQPPNARKQQPEDLLPPIVDFDALFIPDSAKALGQIAPMLAYNDVKSVQLIGTNLWNTPTLIERAGKFLKNSLFVDTFLSTDPSLINSNFYKLYVQAFNETPEEFELQAYDSALILKKALDGGASTRVDVQRSLAALNQIPGGLSTLSMSEAREVARPLVVLTVQDNQIIRAAEAQAITH